MMIEMMIITKTKHEMTIYIIILRVIIFVFTASTLLRSPENVFRETSLPLVHLSSDYS